MGNQNTKPSYQEEPEDYKDSSDRKDKKEISLFIEPTVENVTPENTEYKKFGADRLRGSIIYGNMTIEKAPYKPDTEYSGWGRWPGKGDLTVDGDIYVGGKLYSTEQKEEITQQLRNENALLKKEIERLDEKVTLLEDKILSLENIFKSHALCC